MTELRAYSCLCMLAGLLRVVSSFIEYQRGNDVLELLYMVIDLCFILGLLGFYLLYRESLAGEGRLGLVMSICGFGLIAGPEVAIFGVGIYQIGSPVIGFGVVLLSIGIIRSGIIGYIAPAFLIASVAAGFGSLAFQIEVLFVVSGVLFGCGFVALGASMWVATKPPSIESTSQG